MSRVLLDLSVPAKQIYHRDQISHCCYLKYLAHRLRRTKSFMVLWPWYDLHGDSEVWIKILKEVLECCL